MRKIEKFLRFILTNVRYAVYCNYMTMVREAIKKRMNELKLNPNRLSVMLKKEGIPRQTIYDFLSGRTDARTEVVSALMKALDLELRPIRKKSKKKAR